MSGMTVYEPEHVPAHLRGDLARFDSSVGRLEAAGIRLRRVLCTSADVMDAGEARDTYEMMGPGALPIAEYDGVCVTTGAYPTDQELTDFLDVPEEVLGVRRTGAPAAVNDMPPHCFIRPRDRDFRRSCGRG